MRVVVAGLGVQGNKRALIAGAEVVATCDPVNPAAKHKSIKGIPLESFDAALVCVPDQAKFGVIEYLLANGKHVLVEKPLLSANESEIINLTETARSKNIVCYTAYNHRFEPHIARLKEILDSGVLGAVYSARFFYGNGTARDVRQSPWRDQGLGVLSDLGSHLLDTALFLFGDKAGPFEIWNSNQFENRSLDHVVFGSKNRPVLQLEATLLSWRNTFTADIFADKGTAHIHGLCKWGPSVLTLRKRKLPSGKPQEESWTLECPDPTWAQEYQYFKKLCQEGRTNLHNDIWINAVLNELARPAGVESLA
ncbi:MAG: Gfo/Idh/MocA family oxidoreductase [Elusimicrobia bacterium]|nr:Gfo/Idh/MocA family oxidoreductase [Elusimicrobiota bacterium]